MAIDISNLAQENHRYAIRLATREKVIAYKNGFFSLENYVLEEPHFVVDFYRNTALACELLLKAALLKYHINFFKRRENCEYGEKVIALTNKWLAANLKELTIDYISQINTGTAASTLKAAEAAFGKLSIEKEKFQFITKAFYLIIRTRRNRNSHFFFSNMARFDISEVEMVYLPLLNILEDLYEMPKRDEFPV